MNPSEQVDLLDLELSHEAEDDVSKPVSNDGMQLFNYDHETQPMLGTKSTESLEMGSMSSMGNNLNQTPTSKTGEPIDPNAKCWSIQYYQPWFDIDTNQELHRLKKSLLPFLASNFFDKELDEKPDLYGPFWITTTLAFLMAAMGNFASYINTAEENAGQWSGDITRISEAATFLYTESCLVPILLYIVLRTYAEKTSMVELVSLYGYSLTPFIVSCILCIAPWNGFDWTVVMVAMCLSMWFLVKNIYQPLEGDKRSKPGMYVLAIIFGCQFILGLALKLYFFKY